MCKLLCYTRGMNANWKPPGCLVLFLGFLRQVCTAFGGPAMAPYIRELAVERKKWCSEESFRVGMAWRFVLAVSWGPV